MGDKENLEKAMDDTKEMVKSKAGRRVLGIAAAVGVLAVVILLVVIRGCP